MKIPLFSRIISTKKHTIKCKYVTEEGDYIERPILLQNTNKLLFKNSGCLGGKTGHNKAGGDCFAGVFEGSIMVVVLGCTGSDEKFSDCERLYTWLKNKLILCQMF